MSSKIEIAPEEIFYLGKMCSAKYIDYAYIAAMPEIGTDIGAFEKKTQEQLVKKGILAEDFSGNVELDDQVKATLQPIYFGEVESELCIRKNGDVDTVHVTKYHFDEDAITKVNSGVESLQISKVDLDEIQKDISGSLDASVFSETPEILENPDSEKTNGVISVKATRIGKKSVVKVYVILDGKLYEEAEKGLESVTKSAFEEETGKILKGEI